MRSNPIAPLLHRFCDPRCGFHIHQEMNFRVTMSLQIIQKRSFQKSTQQSALKGDLHDKVRSLIMNYYIFAEYFNALAP